MKQCNILFLNAGRRVELLQAFRRACDALEVIGHIIATDISPLAPALYVADRAFILPHSSGSDFLARLGDLCQKQGVDLIVPLIDPDLLTLSRSRSELEASTQTRVLVSSEEVIATCRDKRRTAAFLAAQGFRTPRLLTPAEVRAEDYPLFIKSADGSGSAYTYRVNNEREMLFFSEYVPNALVQEFIEGDEFTADTLSSFNGKPLFAVARRRLKARAGEIAIGYVDTAPCLTDLALAVVDALHVVGPAAVQFIRRENEIFFTEVNPRFGGGVPLTIRAGADYPRWLLELLIGRPLSRPSVIEHNLHILRYDESLFLSQKELLM